MNNERINSVADAINPFDATNLQMTWRQGNGDMKENGNVQWAGTSADNVVYSFYLGFPVREPDMSLVYTYKQLMNADFDGDGKVTSSDYYFLRAVTDATYGGWNYQTLPDVAYSVFVDSLQRVLNQLYGWHFEDTYDKWYYVLPTTFIGDDDYNDDREFPGNRFLWVDGSGYFEDTVTASVIISSEYIGITEAIDTAFAKYQETLIDTPLMVYDRYYFGADKLYGVEQAVDYYGGEMSSTTIMELYPKYGDASLIFPAAATAILTGSPTNDPHESVITVSFFAGGITQIYLTSAAPSTDYLYISIDTLIFKALPVGNIDGDTATFDVVLGSPITKSYSFTSQGIGSGSYYRAGYYEAPLTDANLTQASTTQTLGTANISYAAHAFVVISAAGSTDAGVVGLRVTGTRIQDDGTRTTSYIDVLSDDITSLSANEYLEGVKFIGQITYELYTVSGTPTTYSLDFNYGFAKYDDFGNLDFEVKAFEAVGLAGATDNSFDIILYHHQATGWTYSAAAFAPDPPVIVDLQTDHNTEYQLANGIPFAYKRTQLTTAVAGSEAEGVIIEIITGQNNSVQSMDAHLTVILKK
jgi:hypothetical protein